MGVGPAVGVILRFLRGLCIGGSRCSSSSVERFNGKLSRRLLMKVLSLRLEKSDLVLSALSRWVRSLLSGAVMPCATLYSRFLYDFCARYWRVCAY